MVRDLNDLQFFVAVVVNRGFSAASRVLGVPKSRVSRRIALLEERLGVRLLDRTTRGLGVTQVGQQVYQHAQAAVIEADAVEEVALRMQAEPRGLVRLTCPLGLQGAIAGPLPGFLAAHPQLRVQCIATNRRVDLIHEGIDVAIRVRERLDTDADLQVKRIGVSRRILVASPNLLAKTGAPKSPADLGNFPILDQDEQSGGTWLLTAKNGETSSLSVEPRLASGSFDILMAAACQGAGITLLPARYCQDALVSGALVRVLPEWGGTEGILHLVFASRRGMLPGVRAVIDFAAAALRSSAAS
ncbi:DNA-binding transcriptional LysR family regulator [Bradyrhizobium sp. S3.2.6]|uniref:LysR substrate-binding domain-containing protein n=1 Tax=Bradyrhizobium sp. S3.2.6 TaxID=3156428 RepID=UPI00339760FE